MRGVPHGVCTGLVMMMIAVEHRFGLCFNTFVVLLERGTERARVREGVREMMMVPG
jgi:hypothetical protein